MVAARMRLTPFGPVNCSPERLDHRVDVRAAGLLHGVAIISGGVEAVGREEVGQLAEPLQFFDETTY